MLAASYFETKESAVIMQDWRAFFVRLVDVDFAFIDQKTNDILMTTCEPSTSRNPISSNRMRNHLRCLYGGTLADGKTSLDPVQFSSVQFSSVQFSSVQFSSVQFSSVQFSSAHFTLLGIIFFVRSIYSKFTSVQGPRRIWTVLYWVFSSFFVIGNQSSGNTPH